MKKTIFILIVALFTGCKASQSIYSNCDDLTITGITERYVYAINPCYNSEIRLRNEFGFDESYIGETLTLKDEFKH